MKKLNETSVIHGAEVPSCSVKALLYRQLQPVAAANGMKVLVLSREDGSVLNDVLRRKRKTFGISQESVQDLSEKLDGWYQCIVVLKSVGRRYGAPEIAEMFGISKDYVKYLTSKNAKNSPVWGDLDVDNDLFLYWFPIDFEDIDDFRA